MTTVHAARRDESNLARKNIRILRRALDLLLEARPDLRRSDLEALDAEDLHDLLAFRIVGHPDERLPELRSESGRRGLGDGDRRRRQRLRRVEQLELLLELGPGDRA